MIRPFAPYRYLVALGEVWYDACYDYGLPFGVFYLADGLAVFLVREDYRIDDTRNEVLILLRIVHAHTSSRFVWCNCVYYIPSWVSSQA